MKKISFLLVLLVLVCTIINAQSFRKTTFTSSKASVVNVGALPDDNYNASLIHVDQHPVPYYTDFGNKKKQAQLRRASSLRTNKSQATSYKTLGIAADPIVDTGWMANGGGIPMDNDIAISNDGKIISAVNSNFYVYDTIGNRLGIRGISSIVPFLNQFDRVSDPRLLYDPKEDRFILVCFSGNTSTTSKIIIGFTASNDPLGNWNFYQLTGNPFNDSTWSDYPIISISDQDLFMTFNQIQDNIGWQNGFRQSVIYQIQKAEGYAATPLQYNIWDSIKYGNTLYRNICPAKYQVSNMDDDMYFLSVRNVDVSNDSVFLIHIDDSYQSGTASMTQRALISPVPYGFPPNPSMNNGNYLMTNDGRVLAAIIENDNIHFGANTIHPSLSVAAVLLGEIQNASSTTPTVKAQVFGDLNTEYGYPSMTYMGGTTGDHRVMFNLQHCYTDSFPGISAVYKSTLGQFSDVVRVVNGNGAVNNLTDTNERWGDYSGIQVKYNNPNSAYLAGSYTPSTSYRAWVARILNADWPLNINEQTERNAQPNVYPNPVAHRRFSTQFSLAKKENLQFNLYDMNGRVIQNLLNARGKIGENKFSFDTNSLAPGNYIFTITGEQEKIHSETILIE